MDLTFRLLQEELTPCYTKMSGATVTCQTCEIVELGDDGKDTYLTHNIFSLAIVHTCIHVTDTCTSHRYMSDNRHV